VPSRALALLSLADPEADPGALPVGEVNARLLDLRYRLFGPQLTCIADCPQCSERLELSFSVADLQQTVEPLPAELEVTVGAEVVRFRLPTWLDLAAVAESAAAPRDRILRRCLSAAEGEGAKSQPLSAALVEAVSAAMEAADPRAEFLIAVGCDRCGSEFEARFDIVEYLWSEVDVRARRLLAEVHALASAYGWREADVLALSPARRRVYLDMAVGK
jgi:hypothetical protein